MTIPNVVLMAATDRAISQGDLRVYLFLYTQLDVLQYRPIKQTWLARRLQMHATHISRSIGRLLRRGYLEEPRHKKKRGPWMRSYRLVLSPYPIPPEPPKPLDKLFPAP